MPKQEPPYTRLIDSARRQPEKRVKILKEQLLDSLLQNYSTVLDQLASIFTLLMTIATLVVMY